MWEITFCFLNMGQGWTRQILGSQIQRMQTACWQSITCAGPVAYDTIKVVCTDPLQISQHLEMMSNFFLTHPTNLQDHLLLIEDDAGIAFLVQDILQALDLKVVHVATGKDARQWLEHHTPRLILLDLTLPDITGLKLLEQLAATPRGLPPFIVVTGMGDERLAVTLMKRGARDYLVKDASFLDALPLVVNRVLKEIVIEQQLEQSEQALRASEEKYRTLIETINTGIFMSTIDGRFLQVNTAISLMAGYDTPDEFMQLPAVRLYADKTDRERLVAVLQQNGFIKNLEIRSVKKDGTIYWISMSAVLLKGPDSQPVALLGSVIDVTERRQAEEALRLSQELLSKFIRQSPIYTYIKETTPTQSRFIYASDNHIQLIGISGSDMVGKTMEELFPPESAAKFTADDWTVVSNSKVLNLDEELNGRQYTTIKFPIFQGDKTLLAGYTIDITETKELQAALEKERAILEEKVAERTSELSQANASLLQAGLVKDEFLATMSHELRTPLTGILGLTQVLKTGIYGEQNEKTSKAVRDIEECGQHLLVLINDILDLSKAQAGKIELDLHPVAVEDVVQSSLQMILPNARKKRITITTTLDSAIEEIVVDERRLKQILVNLLSNAVKFTHDGGFIGVEVNGMQEGRIVDFIVWDTGIGISHMDVDRLFEPFVQLDTSLSRNYEGTGLGLALVYKLVELHGGTIRVESQPGKGSRFIFSLPWRKIGSPA